MQQSTIRRAKAQVRAMEQHDASTAGGAPCARTAQRPRGTKTVRYSGDRTEQPTSPSRLPPGPAANAAPADDRTEHQADQETTRTTSQWTLIPAISRSVFPRHWFSVASVSTAPPKPAS